MNANQINEVTEVALRELSDDELGCVSGGLAPLAIIGIDLALNGVLIGAATYWAMNYHESK